MSSAKRHAADRMHSAAIHLLRRARAADDDSMGMTPARRSALSVLIFGGPQSLSELASAEQVTLPTMSKLVAAMEREGLVRRERDPGDGRAVRLHATAKGRRVIERGRERRLALLESLLHDASAREVEIVRQAAEIVDSRMLRLE
jgi:DNA-binding MarR family transcriptional regulator